MCRRIGGGGKAWRALPAIPCHNRRRSGAVPLASRSASTPEADISG